MIDDVLSAQIEIRLRALLFTLTPSTPCRGVVGEDKQFTQEFLDSVRDAEKLEFGWRKDGRCTVKITINKHIRSYCFDRTPQSKVLKQGS